MEIRKLNKEKEFYFVNRLYFDCEEFEDDYERIKTIMSYDNKKMKAVLLDLNGNSALCKSTIQGLEDILFQVFHKTEVEYADNIDSVIG